MEDLEIELARRLAEEAARARPFDQFGAVIGSIGQVRLAENKRSRGWPVFVAVVAVVVLVGGLVAISRRDTTVPASSTPQNTTTPVPASTTVSVVSSTVVETDPTSLETTSPVSSADGPQPTNPNVAQDARHLDHAALAGQLPRAVDLSWLPVDVMVEDDSDLTSRLVEPDCSGPRADVPSRQSSATNRQFVSGQERLVSITFYDVETVDDARIFMSALHGYISCPSPPSTVVTFEVVNLNTSAQCDDVFVVRTHQPVSETIDAWCQVANLVAWIRLYPTGSFAAGTDSAAPAPIAPTDQQADQTVIVTATALRAAWNIAS